MSNPVNDEIRDGAPEPKVDDERRDIVDRGVVLNSWLKSAAMTVLRIL
ncbi:AI-2E family transporter, partial [Corynebacterium sanguinis]|nr:AI-2E family transporter [Corynebacterium sanguinis]